jgi:tetratricopeptide (TPR) repeat protein
MTGPVSDPVLSSARAAAAAGAWGDVRATLERDVSEAERDATRAMLLADACLWTGDPKAATHWLESAVPLLTRAGDRPALRRAVNMQGAAAFALGTLDRADDRFSTALNMARTDGDALLTARATNNLGAIAAVRGDADQAIASYQLAIPAYQRMGNARGLAESWHNLGIAYRVRGELDPADDAERRAIEFADEAANIRLATMAKIGRAEISLRRGDPTWARATAQRAATVFGALPDYLLQADALRLAADAADRIGLTSEADDAMSRALDVARHHEHRLQEAQALQTRAQIELRRGHSASARDSATLAHDVFAEIGSMNAVEEMSEFLAALPDSRAS